MFLLKKEYHTIKVYNIETGELKEFEDKYKSRIVDKMNTVDISTLPQDISALKIKIFGIDAEIYKGMLLDLNADNLIRSVRIKLSSICSVLPSHISIQNRRGNRYLTIELDDKLVFRKDTLRVVSANSQGIRFDVTNLGGDNMRNFIYWFPRGVERWIKSGTIIGGSDSLGLLRTVDMIVRGFGMPANGETPFWITVDIKNKCKELFNDEIIKLSKSGRNIVPTDFKLTREYLNDFVVPVLHLKVGASRVGETGVYIYARYLQLFFDILDDEDKNDYRIFVSNL